MIYKAYIAAILDSLPESICIIDFTGKVLYVNDTWNEFASTNGYSKDSQPFINYNYFDICRHNFDDTYSQAILEGLHSILEGKVDNFKYEYPCHSSNKKQWFLIRAHLMKGKYKQIVISHNDISTQKLAKSELTAAKENTEINNVFLDNIINNIGDAVFVKDQESRLLLVNDAFCELFKLNRKNIIGKTLAEDVSLEERNHFFKIDKHVIQTGEESIVEESLTVRGGKTKMISTRKTRYVDTNKKKHVIGVIRDITSQKITELKAIENNKKFKNLADTAQVAIAILETAYGKGYLYVNSYWEKLTGYSKKEAKNLDVLQIIDPEYREKIAVNATKRLEGQNVLDNYEIKLITKSGETKWVEFTGLLTSFDGKKAILTTALDITKRREIEIKLEQSKQLLESSQRISKIGGWELDLLNDILFWTDETYRIFETTPAEFSLTINKGISYFLPESKEIIKEALHLAKETGKGYDLELKKYTTKGNLIDVRTTCIATFNNGKPVKLTGIIQDITDIKKNEKKLRKAFEEISELKKELEAENRYLKQELKLDGKFEEIIGSSKSLSKVLKQVEQVAKTDSTVLILGETGTGKELIAKAIHEASDRKNKPLVKVNCAALPAELIESELFGHERGAFTGAVNRKIGRFELANGGTIFLDEIGDLPLDLQTRLLRVLQENEFERVGGIKTIKVNTRVITATNRNLEERVLEGAFRQDLYYRLNVFPITCPPLRDRKEDIEALTNHFINKYNYKVNDKIKSINTRVIEKLTHYKWPGNIRELEHVIERAVIMNIGGQLRLGNWFMDNNQDHLIQEKFNTLETMEKNHILNVLRETNWKIRGENGASEILDIKPTTLESRMKKLNISR